MRRPAAPQSLVDRHVSRRFRCRLAPASTVTGISLRLVLLLESVTKRNTLTWSRNVVAGTPTVTVPSDHAWNQNLAVRGCRVFAAVGDFDSRPRRINVHIIDIDIRSRVRGTAAYCISRPIMAYADLLNDTRSRSRSDAAAIDTERNRIHDAADRAIGHARIRLAIGELHVIPRTGRIRLFAPECVRKPRRQVLDSRYLTCTEIIGHDLQLVVVAVKPPHLPIACAFPSGSGLTQKSI